MKQKYQVTNHAYTHTHTQTSQNRVKGAKHLFFFFFLHFVSFLLKCVPQTQTRWETSEVFHRNRSSLQQAVQVLFSSLFFAVGRALLGAVGVVIVLQDCYDIMMAEMNGLVHGSVAPPVRRSKPKFKDFTAKSQVNVQHKH